VRVILIVSSYRYTGAAAVAEHTCRALREAGIDARLLFLAGDNLEQRLRDQSWAVAQLRKERSPALVAANLSAVRSAAAGADAVISHLPHDHLLCVVAGIHRRTCLVRSYRSPRHLRADPYHRLLVRRATAATLAHSELEPRLDRLAPRLPRIALPVALEDRFRPVAPGEWRERLAIPTQAPVLGMVGKLAAERGFDLLLAAAACLRHPAHVLVVGHGEAQPALQRQALELGLGERVHWAGYQEEALPELLATMDVVLFAAAGSDHGHRAISEAQGCARPVVAAALPGVADLVEDGVTGRIADPCPAALAEAVDGLLADNVTARGLAEAAAEAVLTRRFAAVGERLSAFLAGLPSPIR
jgi:glycosyltransferase involved in cell wall biosynthesis